MRSAGHDAKRIAGLRYGCAHQILEVVAKEADEALAARAVSVARRQSAVVALLALETAARHATAAPVRHEARPTVGHLRAVFLDAGPAFLRLGVATE